MLVLILALGLGLTGCATPAGALYAVNGVIDDFQTIRVPAKDFISLGIVLSEGSISSNQGEVYTYYALLREAQRLGADAIVNVTMSKKKRVESTDEIWYGAATAIKYVTGTLTNVSTNRTDTGTTVTETVIMAASASNTGASINTASAAVGTAAPKRVGYRPSTWFSKE